MRQILAVPLAVVFLASTFAFAATPSPGANQLAEVAPDPTDVGPLATTSAEYKFSASLDPDVLAIRPTEVWAQVYRPADLTGGPFPLLVFLHGNHGTCGTGENPRVDDSAMYTFTGTCPPNYVVTPNHLGYEYIGDRLASWGYIVASINANRGINAAPGTPDDLGLNLARGRLILKHLQRLSEWNRFGGTPESLGVDLQGKLDFSNVGLFGHSRGGEGIRAAYNLFRDRGSPWPERIGRITFKGLFEVGPVDGQTIRLLNADGATWTVLLPMCDGDVSNLQGIKPFDRMLRITNESPAQKSTFTVWGANHNYYNTEWQLSDSTSCAAHDPLWSGTIGSPEQRQTGLAGAMAFFRGNVGAEAQASFNQIFNPQFDLPDVVKLLTQVDRGFSDSPNATVTRIFEDFDRPTGTNTHGFPNLASSIQIEHSSVPNHDASDPFGRRGTQRAGNITWTTAGDSTFFQTNWAAPGTGVDISAHKTLDLRLSRQCQTSACQQTHPLNPQAATMFSIRLVMADGSMSAPVLLDPSSADLTGPVGGLFFTGASNLHPILQTARISLAEFGGADLTNVRGIRLTFDLTPSGAIHVANIRLSTRTGVGAAGSRAGARPASAVVTHPSAETQAVTVIRSIRSVASSPQLEGRPGVEIELESAAEFPVRDELAVLGIGDREFALSRYPADGSTRTFIFTLTPEEFAQTATGDSVTVQYGSGPVADQRDAGRLDKALLDR